LYALTPVPASPDTSATIPAREVRAAPPGPDAPSLRAAYLDLLKLSLCDLACASTSEVTSDRHKRVFSRELVGAEQLSWRVEGRDWPLDGLTMVGLKRLDDLQACVESVLDGGVGGDLIEAGAWRGGASILIRATLDCLGAHDRTLWVADSFQGFPVPEAADVNADRELESHMSEIAFPAPDLPTVRSYFDRFGCGDGVNFVQGFFEDTMASLAGRRWSLIRLDADTYKATRLALETLYPGLSAGGHVILDDYFHPFLAEACRRAVDDFRREHAINEPIHQIDYTGARWRRESEPDAVPGGSRPVAPGPGRRARAGGAPPRIPTDHELQLTDELVTLQARVGAAAHELEKLQGSPLAGPLAWWSRRRAGPGGAST
jgi:hypothetical protein